MTTKKQMRAVVAEKAKQRKADELATGQAALRRSQDIRDRARADSAAAAQLRRDRKNGFH